MTRVAAIVEEKFNKEIKDCSNRELYQALMALIKQKANSFPLYEGKKKLYYISAEFLIGKLLSNHLVDLGIYQEVKDELNDHGIDLQLIEEEEIEPSLGNGGLGRLAACFMESIATLGIQGDGVGLNYHYGLFRQVFEDKQQKALPDTWITEDSWLQRSDIQFDVPFRDFTLRSTLYDIDVLGYKQEKKNRLRLFDLDSVTGNIIQEDSIQFDKTNIKEALTLFLYPDDSDYDGKMLRLYQQYFMVSNAAQLIIHEAMERGSNLKDLADYAIIQTNDTHPALVIPEMIRLLWRDHNLGFDEAVQVTRQMVAFTNHTILAEALEKWPMSDIACINEDIAHIIRELARRVEFAYPDKHDVHIIDRYDLAHMASMSIHYGYSINGVARLHTEILKNTELAPFYEIYPDKFSNKTNGVTFRRWLIECNPELAALLDEKVGQQWRNNQQLQNLLTHNDDPKTLQRINDIKHHNKLTLKKILKARQGIEINADSIIDVHVKRIHEYKRQQMLALYVIYKYMDIKNGNIPQTPITIIFGGKAAMAYTIARDIIHLILSLSQLIAEDPDVSPHLQVVMVENYNVSYASYLVPATDISEQISLASKEASGTGNMKFMMNGALTICTLDGANVEIADRVGKENIYLFGKSSEEIVDLYAHNAYNPHAYYYREAIKPLVDFIVSDQMLALGDEGSLRRLHGDIANKDYFMAMIDLEEFIALKEQVYKDYEDREAWTKKVIKNISEAGFFSSDRTINDYNEDIWHLDQEKDIQVEHS